MLTSKFIPLTQPHLILSHFISQVSSSPAQTIENFRITSKRIDDAICCIAASKKTLIIARESGTIQRYSLPHIGFENKYIVKCRPAQISLNCDDTSLSIIDANSGLQILDLREEAEGDEESKNYNNNNNNNNNNDDKDVKHSKLLPLERKDAWDFKWSEDNPVSERSKKSLPTHYLLN